MKIAEELQSIEQTLLTAAHSAARPKDAASTYGLLIMFRNADLKELSGFQQTMKQLKRLRRCQAAITRRLVQPIDPKRKSMEETMRLAERKEAKQYPFQPNVFKSPSPARRKQFNYVKKKRVFSPQ